MSNVINTNIFSPRVRSLVLTLAMTKRLEQLKQQSVGVPGTRPHLKKIEPIVGNRFFRLTDFERNMIQEERFGIGTLWVDWLVALKQTSPAQVPILRFIFEKREKWFFRIDEDQNVLPDPNYLPDKVLPPAAKLDLPSDWWNCLQPPLTFSEVP